MEISFPSTFDPSFKRTVTVWFGLIVLAYVCQYAASFGAVCAPADAPRTSAAANSLHAVNDRCFERHRWLPSSGNTTSAARGAMKCVTSNGMAQVWRLLNPLRKPMAQASALWPTTRPRH
jgi:hypothetical protein